MTDEESKTEEVSGPPDQFVGRDLLESYMYYRNYIPSNPIEAYVVKKKCIEFGKELLPSFIDPDEKDEEQTKRNKKNEEDKNKLYKKACDTLKGEIPKKRKITYDQQGKTQETIYLISASDADDCECLDKDFKDMTNNFTNQQHEQHMGKLEEIDNEIFHILSMTGIVPAINPTIDQLINEKIKDAMRGEDQ